MPLQTCYAGANQGFPVLPPAPITNVLGSADQSIIVPQDILNVAFASNPPSFTVDKTNTLGILSLTSGSGTSSTITYGTTIYNLLEKVQIVKNQHTKLTGTITSEYEMILTFYNSTPSSYSTSPNIILLCRPIYIDPAEIPSPAPTLSYAAKLWNYINNSTGSKINKLDIKKIYTFPTGNSLMPMVAYSACLPVQLYSSSTITAPLITGSISMRVYVVNQPLVIQFSTPLAPINNAMKYTLPVPIGTLFPTSDVSSSYNILQFVPYPSSTTVENRTPQLTTVSGSDKASLAAVYEYVVPDDLLGMSVADIAGLTDNTPGPQGSVVHPRNTQFKCYQIDPTKDIKNNTIMVDPQTGLPLADMMTQKKMYENGGNPSLSLDANTGLMPGDWQKIMMLMATVIITLGLVGHFGYMCYARFHVPPLLSGWPLAYNIAGFLVVLGLVLLLSIDTSKKTG